MVRRVSQQGVVPDDLGGERLDHIAVILFPEFSRSQLQTWIKAGDLTVNGAQCKPRQTLKGREKLALDAEMADISYEAEQMDLDIVFEDEHLLVLNKSAGVVVHPAPGNFSMTLLNGLLYYLPSNRALARAGIVHRLDKETTGLMVVAKTTQAQNHLVQQLQARTVSRVYDAVVYGNPPSTGFIDQPIARHPVHRTRMAVRIDGKPARTRYEVIEAYPHHALLKVSLETGRTHQIRVHLSYLGYGIVGDPVYSRLRLPAGAGDELREALRGFRRQALHAARLSFEHPHTGELQSFRVGRPDDLVALLEVLRYGEA